jgi:apolipoprotein D and lipocalin family protein
MSARTRLLSQVWAFRLALFISALTLGGCQADPPLEVAPSLNLSQLQGKWYEIARLPRTTQVDCHGTTAFYTRAADGSLSLVNQCNVGSPSGPLQTVAMKATVPDTSVPAKLALDVGGYTGDYWVLEVGANYDYAVIGHPSRLYLWILSRTPTLAEQTMSGILSRAQNENFDTTQLEYTPQPPMGERATLETPQGSVPAPPHAGCDIARTRFPERSSVIWDFVGLTILGAGVQRRSARRRRSKHRGRNHAQGWIFSPRSNMATSSRILRARVSAFFGA